MKILWSSGYKERHGLPDEIPDSMLSEDHAKNIPPSASGCTGHSKRDNCYHLFRVYK